MFKEKSKLLSIVAVGVLMLSYPLSGAVSAKEHENGNHGGQSEHGKGNGHKEDSKKGQIDKDAGKGKVNDKEDGKGHDIKGGHGQKGKLKRADSISKRLGKIEADITKVSQDAEAYFNSDIPVDDPSGDKESSDSNDDATTPVDEQGTGDVPDAEGTTTGGDAATKDNGTVAEDGTGILEAQSVATIESEPVESDKSSEEADTDIENKVEDMEHEVKEDHHYHSFFGKLHALLNKLNAVEKQINHLSGKGVDAAEVTALQGKVDELRTLALTEMDKIKGYVTSEQPGTEDPAQDPSTDTGTGTDPSTDPSTDPGTTDGTNGTADSGQQAVGNSTAAF